METPKRLWEVFQEGHEDTVHDSDTTQASLTNYTLHWVVRFLKEILEELRRHPPLGLSVYLAEQSPGETVHGNRLDLVKHVAIEELNVAPQVAEYARRILMGCRPEPDLGVIQTLLGYTGQRIHPAALELARRILAGEGPSVEVHHRVRQMICLSPHHEQGTPADQAVTFGEPRTVLVVGADVDLEAGDLGEGGDEA